MELAADADIDHVDCSAPREPGESSEAVYACPREDATPRTEVCESDWGRETCSPSSA